MSPSSEPVEMQASWLERIAGEFDPKPEYLIPVLQFVQANNGYLPPEAMQAAARYLKIPESKVYGVASFYAQFHFQPRGKHTLTVCRGTACHVRGSGRLLGEMENVLGVEPGAATEDLTFSLETVACFGACALAPVVVIDDQVHRQQTPASLRKMVLDIRAQALKSRGSARNAQPVDSRSGGKRKGRPGKPRRSK